MCYNSQFVPRTGTHSIVCENVFACQLQKIFHCKQKSPKQPLKKPPRKASHTFILDAFVAQNTQLLNIPKFYLTHPIRILRQKHKT